MCIRDSLRTERPDRHDDRRLGRRRRPRHQRLPQRHGRVARGAGRSDGGLDHPEGQGSLDHPAYSSVTLGLIHGATPHAMVLVHKVGLAAHDFDHLPDRSFPIAPLRPFIELHERIAATVAPSKVVAVAVNTSLIADEAAARRAIAEVAAETGLPTDDPVRFGAGPLWSAIRAAVDALPWVAGASA